MGGAAEKITITEPVRRLLPEPLDGIGEQGDFPFPAEIESFAPRLKHAGLVVCRHDCDQTWPGAGQLAFQPVEIDNPVGCYWDGPQAPSEQTPGSHQHARMLDCADPYLGVLGELAGEMVKNRVGGLCSAGGPDEIERIASKHPGQFLARAIQCRFGPASDPVRARRVPWQLFASTQPCFPRGRVNWRCSVVVEVNHPKMGHAGSSFGRAARTTALCASPKLQPARAPYWKRKAGCFHQGP